MRMLVLEPRMLFEGEALTEVRPQDPLDPRQAGERPATEVERG